jgi:hypothetical protein
MDTIRNYPASTLSLIKGKWYVSVTVPVGLRPAFNNRTQVKVSTGTSDRSEAARRQHQKVEGIYEQFDGASHDFYHVTKNLYVVPIPKVGGADTFIEHLFDAKTLASQLNGKSFDFGQKGKKIASNKYGKMAFAKDVVRKNRASIDFSGFLPVLVNIEKALSEHKKMISTQKATS